MNRSSHPPKVYMPSTCHPPASTRQPALLATRSSHACGALLIVFGLAACSPSEESVRAEFLRCDSVDAINAESGLREFRDCPEGPVMVVLPPGRFLMGSPEGDEPAALNPVRPAWTELSEKPQVEVEIAHPFAIGKFEITFEEWDRCVAAGGCSYRPEERGLHSPLWTLPGRWARGDRPVIHIARADAEEYIAWLSRATGQRYRLPSEAEWEYAARGGTTTAYYWGDELGEGMAVCDGCGSKWDKRSTAPVGSFPPNAFGLHDMLGNVSEWVADCWTESHEGARNDGSPRIEASPWWKSGHCERPMQRGGGWRTYPWAIRAAARTAWRPGPWTDREWTYGFRVVREMNSEG